MFFLCCITVCPLDSECLMMLEYNRTLKSSGSERITGERPAERNSWEAAVMSSTSDSHFRWVLALLCVCVCAFVCVFVSVDAV